MFGLIGDLTKAAVGVVIETPVAIIADTATLCGALTEKDEPYTVTDLKGVAKKHCQCDQARLTED